MGVFVKTVDQNSRNILYIEQKLPKIFRPESKKGFLWAPKLEK